MTIHERSAEPAISNYAEGILSVKPNLERRLQVAKDFVRLGNEEKGSAFGPYFAEDAAFVPPGAGAEGVIVGREAIVTFFEDLFSNPAFPTVAEVGWWGGDPVCLVWRMDGDEPVRICADLFEEWTEDGLLQKVYVTTDENLLGRIRLDQEE